MRLVVKPSADDVAQWISRRIVDRVNCRKPTAERPFVLGLSTGVSTILIYKWLVHFFRRGKISFEHVVTFALDEYVSLPRDHPYSKHSSMWHNFFKHIDIKRENVHMLDGNSNDLAHGCTEYEQKIQELGGIDLIFMGTGPDGTVGRNEPGSSMTSRTRVKHLAQSTINLAFGTDLIGGLQRTELPQQSLTMGIATLMEVKEIVLIFCGRAKALALHKTVEGNISHMCPSSAMQLHCNCSVVCDKAATMELRVATSTYFCSMKGPDNAGPGSSIGIDDDR